MNIILENIGKRYRMEWIYRNVDFTFKSGGAYAILGPNGSGKSTLMKVLSGFLSPSKGTITFSSAQQSIDIDKVYQKVGYAAPYIDLIEDYTLSEMLDFHQKFKPFAKDFSTKAVIELLGFESSKNKPIKFFSSGMKQRLKLAMTICSENELLLLDEPTTNLDAQGVAWYQSLIQQFRNNRLIIVASNIEHDYDFCTDSLNILDYKKKR